MALRYTLYVDFQEDRKDALYNGVSYYNSKLIDHLQITYQQIAITFERSAAIDMENYLFTALNPVRIQLYKAVCFYLVVTGRIPDTNRIWLARDGQEFTLDKDRLTRHWNNCKIAYTMEPKAASKCFDKNGKTCYIAMTYFLKAQLDLFSHDCFRAAWSGLNALYNEFSDDKREGIKLNALSKYLETHPALNAQAYIETLPGTFWKRINWYNYIQNKGLSVITKSVFQSELFQDRTIYSHLGECVIEFYKQKEKKTDEVLCISEKLGKQYIKRLPRKKTRVNEQLRFLTTDYCYMLRNRSFHADKPYPLFGLFDEDDNSIENILTKMLLLLIHDIIEDMAE